MKEIYAHIGPSGKLLHWWNAKTISETVHERQIHGALFRHHRRGRVHRLRTLLRPPPNTLLLLHICFSFRQTFLKRNLRLTSAGLDSGTISVVCTSADQLSTTTTTAAVPSEIILCRRRLQKIIYLERKEILTKSKISISYFRRKIKKENVEPKFGKLFFRTSHRSSGSRLGEFWKFLDNKFPYTSSPKTWDTFLAVLKRITL